VELDAKLGRVNGCLPHAPRVRGRVVPDSAEAQRSPWGSSACARSRDRRSPGPCWRSSWPRPRLEVCGGRSRGREIDGRGQHFQL